jgi:hypothetical protein
MTDLGPVAWPPAPIPGLGLALREPEAGTVQRSSSCSPRQRWAHTSVALDRVMSSSARCLRCPDRRPGLSVIDLDGAMIGMITLDRRDAERPGHVRPYAGEAELG